MLNVTIRQMQTLLTIHAKGRIVSAARTIGLTSPAVTLQLKQVEDEIGVPLFDRTAEGMRATAAGEVFLEAAREILDRMERLEGELDAVRGARMGTLNVGFVSTAHYLIPQLTEAFAQEHPEITVSLTLGNRQETIARLKSHEVDVIMTSRPPRDISVRAVPFAQYQLIVVASPTHPLAETHRIPRTELANETFIVREAETGPRQALDGWISTLKNDAPAHFIEMMSNEDVSRAVIANLGIAFVATHTVVDHLRSGALVALDIEGLPLNRQWFAVTRSDRNLSPAMSRFQDFLMRKGTGFLRTEDAIYTRD